MAFTRVDPKLVTIRRIHWLINLAFLLAAALLAIGLGDSGWRITGYIGLAATVALGAWAMRLVGRQVSAYGYAMTDREFLVCRGIMFRRVDIVPLGRIQSVNIDAGPLYAHYGLVKLSVDTAAMGDEGAVAGVKREDAERMREAILARGVAHMEGV